MRLKALVSNPTDKINDPDRPYIALEHLESGTGRLLSGAELEGKVADDSVAHEAGDVRFGKLRPYLAKSFLAEAPGAGSGELLVLRPGPLLLSRYLWYVVQSQPFVDWAVATSYGVKMPRTSWDAIGAFEIEPPSLDDQRRILGLLDTETARIDELIDEQRRQLDLGVERLVSLREDLLTDRTDVRSVPLQQLTDPARPIVYGIVQAGPEVPDGVPYIKTGDVKHLDVERLSRTSPEIDAAYGRARVVPGDIVMAMRASIGAVVQIPDELPVANLTQGTARIAPRVGVNPRWLLSALQTQAVQQEARVRAVGTTFLTLNIGDLRRLPVPAVPPEVQTELAVALDRAESQSAAMAMEVNAQVRLLREHRQALISAAVTGGLDAVRKMA